MTFVARDQIPTTHSMEDKQSEKLELHYFLAGNSHSMDAFVRHKCESHFLAIAKELAHQLNVEITIESEALTEGGINDYYKFIITTGISALTLGGAYFGISLQRVMVKNNSIITEKQSLLIDKQIENVSVDTELKKIELQKRLNEVKNIDSQKFESIITDTVNLVSENTKIKRQRSNFYETINSYSKVTNISFAVLDEKNRYRKDPININRNEFGNFINTSDEIKIEVDSKARISIVSPVLSKTQNKKYKWKGLYKNKAIDFSMKSEEYTESIEKQEVSFKNGTYILCELEIIKKINAEGDIYVSSYSVTGVSFTQEGDRLVEAPKKRTKIEKPNYQQTSFLDNLG